MRYLIWFTGLAWMKRESMEVADFADFIEEELSHKTVWFITTDAGILILKAKGVTF